MQLNKYDLNWCVRRLPYAVRSMLKKESVIVAGGYIRACILNEPINDVDLFVSDKEMAKEYALRMVQREEKRLIITDNAITIKGMKYPVQFITRWTYETPEQILGSFDFTICQACFWWEKHPNILTAPENDLPGKWCSSVSESFYQDLSAKRLIYTNPIREEEAGGSMLRVLKYYQKGYRITIDSFAAVITRLAAGVEYDDRITDIHGNLFPDQFHKIIRGLLHEVDPNIDPDHIIEDARVEEDDENS
uniref:Poly A polymerase head domain-containing protein n=1 Tax=viral metagenome TaxID=1070528 RepID=A0A6M3LD46_9ZZZZ